MSAAVSGTVTAGFEAVADAFRASFEGMPAMGASLCIRVEGRTVVDLWGGVADARDGRPWQADTPTVVFSCTKALVGIVAAQLVAEGLLDYDAPVAHYWPEFAENGKEGVTVADALSHRAGLSAPRLDLQPGDVLDWQRMTAVLAAQEPLWAPGTGHAYHALTYGWINGEIIRRVTGKSVGQNLRERLAAPLSVDMALGQTQTLRQPPAHISVDAALSQYWREQMQKPEPNWPVRSMTLGHALPVDLVTADGGFNDPRLQAAEIPGAGGIASARALAAICSATVIETDGVRLLQDAEIQRMATARSFGPQVFEAPEPYCTWGLGVQLDSPARRYLTARSFGHDGAGGQVQFADPEHKVGFGFVTNWMMGPDDSRATRILDALRPLFN